MRRILPLLAILWSLGCSPSKPTSAGTAAATAPGAKITQFYTSTPKIGAGEQAQLCYGVENATAVWVEPPRQDLPAVRTNCFSVTPAGTTTYHLTAQGTGGQTVNQDITVTTGAARVHISEVRINTLNTAPGGAISLCYSVVNAVAVTIEPIGFKAGPGAKRCATDNPTKTTTYVVSARGADGDTDSERVTVKVR